MSDPAFREARDPDWPSIWDIFREVVGRGDTYAFPTDIGEDDARTAWMPDDSTGRETFVAEIDGEIVATAYLKPNLPGPGSHVANAAWMVAPAHTGHGVGRGFALHVIEAAREAGFTAMVFNAVVATNRRALALWRSLGFRTVGTVPGAFLHPEHGPTDLHVMHREL
jgi:L-amino acid N-acyltransferase YncA